MGVPRLLYTCRVVFGRLMQAASRSVSRNSWQVQFQEAQKRLRASSLLKWTQLIAKPRFTHRALRSPSKVTLLVGLPTNGTHVHLPRFGCRRVVRVRRRRRAVLPRQRVAFS